jgi:cytochrome P450
MTYILKAQTDDKRLTMDEMKSNAQLMLGAGSETTATMLSGTTYMLLKNPDVMRKLTDEVRNRWTSYSEITLEELQKAPYLLAVISEGLRYFPPVPAGFERQVGKGGEVVLGYYLPALTAVSVSHYLHTTRIGTSKMQIVLFLRDGWGL